MIVKRLSKSAVALAVLVASAGAMAQSAVTIFGVVDVAMTRVSGDGAGSRIGLSSGSSAPSRLGFRGTEDLGGGLSAGFWLEGSLGVDTGTGTAGGALLFQRRSTVSLASNTLGELRLGRDFAPTWWNLAQLDPFGARGIGTTQAANNFGYSTTWNNNTIGYILPQTLGGFYGQLQYAFGEKSSTVPNDKQGNFLGGRFGYQSGPLNVVGSYGQTKQAIGASDVAPVTIGRDLKVANIAATWDFGVVKPLLFYGTEKVDGNPTGNNRLNSLLIGATAPIGAGELRATVARYDLKDSANDFNKLALGYGYNLSKRTQVYGTVARLANKGAGTRSLSADGLATLAPIRAGGNSSGFEVGIRHSF